MSDKQRIAVINDDAVFIDLMAELLQELGGYELLVMHEGDKAYKRVKQEKPNLVVLDIRMERSDTGWTVLELLSLDPETRHIPVIVCTAAIVPEDKKQWLKAHGISLLPKPFDIDDMLKMVKENLEASDLDHAGS